MIPIYGHVWATETVALQDLGSPALDRMTLVHRYEDLLNCHKCLLFVEDSAANMLHEITQQLVDQGNYLVFYNLWESVTSASVGAMGDIRRDFPQWSHFPYVGGGIEKNKTDFGLETFLFRTLSFNNQAQASKMDLVPDGASKPYKFLYLNGRHAMHRLRLWKQFDSMGLLEHALASYCGYGSKLDPSIEPLETPPFRYLPKKYDSKHAQIDLGSENWQYQTRHHRIWMASVWQGQWVSGQLEPISKFTDTHFSVVTETCIQPYDLFVTEKTFKVLMAGHPFIILGSPGLYDYIRKLGFQTYGPWINESFDSETDEVVRSQLVAQEVQKLCQSDLTRFSHDCREINLYNRQNYIRLAMTRYQQLQNEFSDWCQLLIEHATDYVTNYK